MRKPEKFITENRTGLLWHLIDFAPLVTWSTQLPNYDNGAMDAKGCRKLAAWLLKAADWLDHQESVKKKRGS